MTGKGYLKILFHKIKIEKKNTGDIFFSIFTLS